MIAVEGGRPTSVTFDLQQMIDVVRRDLEDLLNTRRTARPSVEAFEETRTSVVAYGMPDLASVSTATESDRREVGRIIEEVIQRCEPRLREVHAHLAEDASGGAGRAVRFHIQARLAVDPSPEIGFETVLELTSGSASVRRSEG